MQTSDPETSDLGTDNSETRPCAVFPSFGESDSGARLQKKQV